MATEQAGDGTTASPAPGPGWILIENAVFTDASLPSFLLPWPTQTPARGFCRLHHPRSGS